MTIRKTIRWAGAAALLMLGTHQASAAVVGTGTAAGHGLATQLSAFNGNLSLSIDPLPLGVSVVAPPPGSVSDTHLGVDTGDTFNPGLLSSTFAMELSTGVLNASAASNVDGGAGARESSASGSVNDLNFQIGTLDLLGLISSSVVDLTAGTIASNASVSGTPGSFVASGSTMLEGASLGVADVSILGLGLGVSADLMASPSANLVIVNALGLTVTLNRQLVNGVAGGSCAANDCHISVDAIALEFSDFLLGGGLLNGELTLGHSEASLSAVPVPAAVWLFGSGLVGLIGVARRRKAAI